MQERRGKMIPILKTFLFQLSCIILIIALVIAADNYIDMRNFYHLERLGNAPEITELQKQVQKQDSIASVHDMQIQLFMQDRGVEIYQLPISDSKSIYFSNTGFLEL